MGPNTLFIAYIDSSDGGNVYVSLGYPSSDTQDHFQLTEDKCQDDCTLEMTDHHAPPLYSNPDGDSLIVCSQSSGCINPISVDLNPVCTYLPGYQPGKSSYVYFNVIHDMNGNVVYPYTDERPDTDHVYELKLSTNKS